MKTIDIKEGILELRGLNHIDYEKVEYYRLSLDVIDKVNENVTELAKEPTGARIRFKTNTKNLYVRYKVQDGKGSDLLSFMACSFISVYIDDKFNGIMAHHCLKNEGYIEYNSDTFLDGEFHEIVIYLPMHDRLLELMVGIDDNAQILKARPYKYEDRVIFYGSSITQGIAASRTGLTYVDQVCKKVDCDYLNLGFSGSAKGEESIAEYIANQKMSVFVLDYDHNAPGITHLRNTHSRFYEIVRKKNPDLPIVILSKPNYLNINNVDFERREIIKKTYQDAKQKGENVYFIDGETYFGKEPERFEYTVDGGHPNDLGNKAMADVIAPVIKKILENGR